MSLRVWVDERFDKNLVLVTPHLIRVLIVYHNHLGDRSTGQLGKSLVLGDLLDSALNTLELPWRHLILVQLWGFILEE